MPDEIENLFSLMDFAHNGKISEQEFLAATGHYRCQIYISRCLHFFSFILNWTLQASPDLNLYFNFSDFS